MEQRYTDYVPETKVEYRPIEKSYTDYIEGFIKFLNVKSSTRPITYQCLALKNEWNTFQWIDMMSI